MKNKIKPLTICLWFDGQAEEAAKFYTSVFWNSKIENVTHYPKAGHEVHGMKEGSVLTVEFTINGQSFIALNAGPLFKFNESVSLQIFCDTQEEIDYYWDKLTEGGQESQCGWLKDKFGFSWQVVPSILSKLMSDPDRVEAVTAAFMQMKKFDLEKLIKA